MEHSSHRYQPNVEHVSAKVLDGEAVLIHVTRGTYHSMDKVGCRIWQLIEQRPSFDAIVSAIASQYEVDEDTARKDVAKLIDELIAAELIVDATEEAVALTLDKATNSMPYVAPSLSTFDDMADLLALDPPMPGLQAVPPGSESDKS